ncbi:GNAT family N-acetyltransferase [Larsenimonas rhizosphaerae]|uniref:GNAT family N-acetyltransferase n=1 Tax=Larsenimonas rhizosphaerae TaxID=2944682 RepID=UPI00203448FF|nr:GNAT family N-acetyltransferase [Larsenimonas rhizosphaerae]MCM2131320.1 GNAT family N-acetyltransferase [Larsenimonas rhizosphaerae]
MMQLIEDDLTHPDTRALIRYHLSEMEGTSPPESRHALDLSGLTGSNVTVYSLWQDQRLCGLGALKALDEHTGEIKSMRTAPAFLRQGVARQLLTHLIAQATRRGYTQVSLETGAHPYFEPAHRLYAAFGFVECPPFAHYTADSNSRFMTCYL